MGTAPRKVLAQNFSGLMGAFTINDCGRRLGQNFKIEPNRPGSRILQIKTNHIVEARAAAAGYLPQSGDTRFDFQNAPAMPGFVSPKLVRDGRARAN